MSYERVIPRDLFNESKLLKCMGALSVLIHDGMLKNVELVHDYPERGFMIDLDSGLYQLFVINLTLVKQGELIPLGSDYNSKDEYPLSFEGNRVFNDDGTLTDDFKQYIEEL